MGKILSKPVASATPGRALESDPVEGNGSSVVLSAPSVPRDVSLRLAPHPDGSVTGQDIPIRNVRHSPSVTASHLDRSPLNPDWDDHGQDGTTVGENGGSPISPRAQPRMPQSSHTRGGSIDSQFSETHRETGKEVFRWSSFGEKQAVQIVCKHLLEVLRQAAASYPGRHSIETLISPRSWIMEPYELIVHNKARIVEHSSILKDGDAKKHFELFLSFLESHKPGVWKKYDEVLSKRCEQVLFEHLWLLYSPGVEVFKIDDGLWRAYVVEKSETIVDTKSTRLWVHAWFLDFDRTGDRLVPHKATFEIPSYSSERSIKMLELIPGWFLSQEQVRQDLIERGKTHLQYGKAPHYKVYTGDAWIQGPHNSSLQVIVDYSTSSRCPVSDNVVSRQDNASCCSACIGASLGLFSYPRDPPEGGHICINSVPLTSITPDGTPESKFLFCPPRLWAFSLKFKTWALVAHKGLAAVEPEDLPIEDLYMDEVRRGLLFNIVSSCMAKGTFPRDGKALSEQGSGLNILLVGSSGTGKTFTAEFLSRKLGYALYTMTCGDLGTQSDVLEQKLQETLTRGANWNAMVLLDDVDVYGYNRGGVMYKRSALLPTFLRHLEFSHCLCFISMASLKEVDRGFLSRLHAEFPFAECDWDSQRHIWKQLIRRLDPREADRELLSRFVDKELWKEDNGMHAEMNGWQIRNCIDVAMVLAQKENPSNTDNKLQPGHIKKILSLRKDFRELIGQNMDSASIQEKRIVLGFANPQ